MMKLKIYSKLLGPWAVTWVIGRTIIDTGHLGREWSYFIEWLVGMSWAIWGIVWELHHDRVFRDRMRQVLEKIESSSS